MAVEWTEGDAEDLPFGDQRFDVILSTFGCMFAPRHEVVADEIARVLRPGGRVGICAWTPEGSIGDFFRAVGAYLPPQRKNGTVNGVFHENGAVWNLADARAISGDETFSTEERPLTSW